MTDQELIAAALRVADAFDAKTAPEAWMQQELREACARAMVQPDMSEVERLIDNVATSAFASALGEMPSTKYKEARAALLAHIQHGVPDGDDGKRVLREVFALCEDTETKCSDETGDFARGRRFEAKGIARAIGAWYQGEFCGRAHMGEPAAPAPDHSGDATEMGAAPAEVPMPVADEFQLRVFYPSRPLYAEETLRNYGDAREAAGYARGLAEAGRDAERYQEVAKRFAAMKTSTSEIFLDCLGMDTSKAWKDFGELLDEDLRVEVK